jgi:hypothetical protein
VIVNKRWRLFAALLACVVLAAAAGACSGDEDEGEPTRIGVILTNTPSPPAAPRQIGAIDFCRAGIESVAGTVASPDVLELSGLAASRTQDVIWAHNDSGDTARVFAMSPTGDALATYDVVGADAFDWEDMAIGPGPERGVSYLYIGDFGDNASIRPSITVYRAPEPTFGALNSSLTIDAYEAMVFMYPAGAHDAEVLLVDPENGDLFIVTKNIAGGPSGVYRAPTVGAVPETLEKVGEIDFAALTPAKQIPAGSGPLPEALSKIPTGGDISPDGRVIAIRTYGTVWLWPREEGVTIAEALANRPCEGPSAVETQGEAIAFTADGQAYITASEGTNVPFNQFSVE